MGHPRPLLRLFSVFANINPILQEMWNIIHLVYGAGIRTQDLLNSSLLPWPLDQEAVPHFSFFVDFY